MDLSFANQHLSIRAFPSVTLPPLTVIVGINGSGKSHLLQAIANGQVRNTVAAANNMRAGAAGMIPQAQEIRLLVNDGGVGTAQPPQQYMSMQNQPMPGMPGGGFEHARATATLAQRTGMSQLTANRYEAVLNGDDVWRIGSAELVARLGETDPEVIKKIEELYRIAEDRLVHASVHGSAEQHGPQHTVLLPVRRVAERLNVPPLELTAEHMEQFSPWGEADQFGANMALVFGRYRDSLLSNRLKQLEDCHNGSDTAFTEGRFRELFGTPPWDQLNATLEAFGLPYEVAVPDTFKFTPVSINLMKKPTGEPVGTANLSSGEKVLYQFALSSFEYDEQLMNVKRPKLLLLDEMDASLHPEMVHRWLGAISNGLVAKQGIHCIITTHSPTTVALAAEDALFEMRDGHSGLTKISKQDALNKLTFGVPTLSIDYSGRRQVFAESDTDAAIYEHVYSLIKSQIACERELNFLSTGMRDKDKVEINSGCRIVKGIVQSLRDAGNLAVYGIVDWDGEAVSTDRVKVIAEGARDGIESVLLDPLLICLLLMKFRRAPEGLRDIDRFVGADALQAPDLQRMVDAVQHAAFPTSTSEKIEVEYIGGARIKVLREYMTINDHDLEAALTNALPALRKWTNRRGDLVKAIVEEVLTEHRTFCPVELKTVFETIANAPA